jgi:hypothetical protein
MRTELNSAFVLEQSTARRMFLLRLYMRVTAPRKIRPSLFSNENERYVHIRVSKLLSDKNSSSNYLN